MLSIFPHQGQLSLPGVQAPYILISVTENCATRPKIFFNGRFMKMFTKIQRFNHGYLLTYQVYGIQVSANHYYRNYLGTLKITDLPT